MYNTHLFCCLQLCDVLSFIDFTILVILVILEIIE